MKAFSFRLEKALEWRRTQFEMEEIRYKRELSSMGEIDRAREQLDLSLGGAESDIRRSPNLTGADLGALEGFRAAVRERRSELAARHAEARKRLGLCESAMLSAKRRYRLLERLKERRLEEWRTAAAHELEEIASESYLARCCREKTDRRSEPPYNEIHGS